MRRGWKGAVAGLLTLGVVGGGAVAVVLGQSTKPTPESADGPPLEFTVQQRPFRSVVTLDARIRPRQAIPVDTDPEQRVSWTVPHGAAVEKGAVIGRTTPDTGEQSLSELESSLAATRRERHSQSELLTLDVSDAQEKYRKATPGERTTAQSELVRARLNLRQTLDKLDAEIDRLTARVAAARKDTHTIKAPVSGTLLREAGGAASVRPEGFEMTAAVPPVLMYRLDGPETGRTAATVKIPGGPPDFSCPAVAFRGTTTQNTDPDLTADVRGSVPSPKTEQGTTDAHGRSDAGTGTASEAAESGGITVVCQIPKEVRVYDGLPGTMAITAVDLPTATVLDASAVRLTSGDKGLVSVRAADGSVTDRTITLGPTDGLSYVVTKGLEPGETVVKSGGAPGANP